MQDITDTETVDRAAIWHRGRTYSVARPGRHHDVIRAMDSAGIDPAQGHQGFITNAGRFVDRKQAMQIAIAAGQLLPLVQDGVPMERTSPELFSEDVW
jgi:hypothetical protein